MKKILLMGEPMALLIADSYGPLDEVEHFTRSLAGAEVNVAIGLARLGHCPAYVTRLGEDPFGVFIKKFLDKEKISTDFVSFDSVYRTGIQLKNKVLEGDPVAPYYRKGSAASHLSVSQIDDISFDEVVHVHVTGILPALSQSCRLATYRLLERAKEHNVYITFDPNLRPALWKSESEMVQIINDLASRADLVLPGVEEGKILVGSDDPVKIADYYQSLGVDKVIVKIGKCGAYIRDKKESYTVAGFEVDQVIDTVGAGDGFAVGIISGKLEGLSLKDMVLRANAIGAMQVTNISDNEGLPTTKELDAFMSANYENSISN
ncbi:MAG: sugar kinase [Breznakia sp.]